MSLAHGNTRKPIKLSDAQWEKVEKEADQRGLSKSKLVEWALKQVKVL